MNGHLKHIRSNFRRQALSENPLLARLILICFTGLQPPVQSISRGLTDEIEALELHLLNLTLLPIRFLVEYISRSPIRAMEPVEGEDPECVSSIHLPTLVSQFKSPAVPVRQSLPKSCRSGKRQASGEVTPRMWLLEAPRTPSIAMSTIWSPLSVRPRKVAPLASSSWRSDTRAACVPLSIGVRSGIFPLSTGAGNSGGERVAVQWRHWRLQQRHKSSDWRARSILGLRTAMRCSSGILFARQSLLQHDPDRTSSPPTHSLDKISAVPVHQLFVAAWWVS